METVEMDLMQAQIGSLATDVSRLEAKVAEVGSKVESKVHVVTFTDVEPISETVIGGTASMSGTEIKQALLNGEAVSVVIDASGMGMGVVTAPITAVSASDIAWGSMIFSYNTSPKAITKLAMFTIAANKHAEINLYL